ncbi:YchJ family protein [Halomonas binhaiensis]|uniref:UPF0225 protein E4T21_10565 n=1 Tax=Halomonas binhaiensis TaxID=2562282 RepID=A0A5C1NI76_9GAMM|nr:YchJ family protein [Halomonas binhaiensis]QEM81947.1 YchJ family protein [Halomonas binhaiensis]
MTPVMPCPCGSGESLAECCGSIHQGQLAQSPQALMRSRFSAFALGLHDYLIHSWHPDTCPASLDLEQDTTRWVRLEILDHGENSGEGNGEGNIGNEGWVHFRATFQEGPPGRRRWGVLEERSRFVRLEGRWVYMDGEPKVTRLKPGRNDVCPCGSGKKFKSCCGR